TPKGAELSHNNLLYNAVCSSNLFGSAEHDVFLTVLPLFHIFGQTTMLNTALYRHATMVLQPRFDGDEALALMEKENVTVFGGVPTMYWGLLGAKGEHDIAKIAANLHTAVSGGSARRGVASREGHRLPGTSRVVSFSTPPARRRPGSAGRPIWGVEMKLLDAEFIDVDGEGTGEIAVRGHCVMKGYHDLPDANAQ